MAEYVKGLGEILAGQREEVHGPQDEIDAIMGKASDKLAAMNRMAKKQNKINQRKIQDESSDNDQDEASNGQSAAPSRRGKKGKGEDDNLPNPDDLMGMLMAQNGGRMPQQGMMQPPGGMGSMGGAGMMAPPGGMGNFGMMPPGGMGGYGPGMMSLGGMQGMGPQMGMGMPPGTSLGGSNR